MAMTPVDRIIESIDWLTRTIDSERMKLTDEQRMQVLVGTFEETVTDSHAFVERLAEHIGTRPAQTMAACMAEPYSACS